MGVLEVVAEEVLGVEVEVAQVLVVEVAEVLGVEVAEEQVLVVDVAEVLEAAGLVAAQAGVVEVGQGEGVGLGLEAVVVEAAEVKAMRPPEGEAALA